MSDQTEIDRRSLIVGGMGAALVPVVTHKAELFDVQELDREISQAAKYLQHCLNRRYGEGFQIARINDERRNQDVWNVMIHKPLTTI